MLATVTEKCYSVFGWKQSSFWSCALFDSSLLLRLKDVRVVVIYFFFIIYGNKEMISTGKGILDSNAVQFCHFRAFVSLLNRIQYGRSITPTYYKRDAASDS